MARKTLYYKSNLFNDYFLNLKETGQTFELSTTTYTRKIKRQEYDVIFNQKGKPDRRALCLINKVRRDGKRYIEAGGLSRDTFIDYFKLFRIPKSNKVIHKIDITSAYWNQGLKLGIIQPETDEYYKELYEGIPAKEAKSARLKAFGSLATKKYFIQYINGERQLDTEWLKVEATRDIYIETCRMIDETMKECAREIDGCYYYYYDCMFVGEGFSNEVVDFFKSKEYNVTVKTTRLEYHNILGCNYIFSIADDKMYCTRREDKHVLLN